MIEARALDTFEGLGEIEKTLRGGHGKNTEGSRHPETFAPGDEDAVTIIHQDQVGVKFDGESNGVFLTRIELFHSGVVDMRGLVYLRP